MKTQLLIKQVSKRTPADDLTGLVEYIKLLKRAILGQK